MSGNIPEFNDLSLQNISARHNFEYQGDDLDDDECRDNLNDDLQPSSSYLGLHLLQEFPPFEPPSYLQQPGPSLLPVRGGHRAK